MQKALMCFILGLVSIFGATALLQAQGGEDPNGTKSPGFDSLRWDDPAGSATTRDPLAKFFANLAKASGAGGYPASSSASAGLEELGHFEIMGVAHWRDLSTSSAVSTGSYTVALNSRLNLGGFEPGPLFRFTWRPGFTLLRARSNVRVEYDQITRSRVHTIDTEITFEDQVYPINTKFKTQLSTKSFQAAWSPEWGNDKLRVGPYVAYQRLAVKFTLTNLTPGAPPPTTRDVNVPNNVAYIGGNFDAYPVPQLNIYGWAGAVPCCGGGWHAVDSEVGVKYFLVRELSIIAGYRYNYLKRDFTVASTTVGSVTTPKISGFLKFPGGGPIVGLSYRF